MKKLTNSFNQSGEKLGSDSETAILINSMYHSYKEVKSTTKKWKRKCHLRCSDENSKRGKELKLKKNKRLKRVEKLYTQNVKMFQMKRRVL